MQGSSGPALFWARDAWRATISIAVLAVMPTNRAPVPEMAAGAAAAAPS